MCARQTIARGRGGGGGLRKHPAYGVYQRLLEVSNTALGIRQDNRVLEMGAQFKKPGRPAQTPERTSEAKTQ
jgi:hypothetical protein